MSELKALASAIAMLDCLVSFAGVAKERGYCRPQILEPGGDLKICDGRHPVVEALSRERFVPNDTDLGSNAKTMVITGPNMAGEKYLYAAKCPHCTDGAYRLFRACKIGADPRDRPHFYACRRER